MSNGTWKVYSNVIGDKKMYIAGRQKDMSKPLHSGNVEYSGEYEVDRDVTQRRVDELNGGVA